MAKSSNPMDAAVAAEKQQGREPMGKEALHFNAAEPQKGNLVTKKNTAAGDPTAMAKPSRSTKQTSARESHGAGYTIKSTYAPQTEPSAGATQANGHVVPPIMVRQSPNFQGGMQSSY
jgi:hypothetical protein